MKFDRIRSQDIKREYNIQAAGERITRRRDEWNECVWRMAPERVVRTARHTSPRGRCGKARRIIDGVTHILETLG
jgi:hypothetical protein